MSESKREEVVLILNWVLLSGEGLKNVINLGEKKNGGKRGYEWRNW